MIDPADRPASVPPTAHVHLISAVHQRQQLIALDANPEDRLSVDPAGNTGAWRYRINLSSACQPWAPPKGDRITIVCTPAAE
jgi:hypothetical protein